MTDDRREDPGRDAGADAGADSDAATGADVESDAVDLGPTGLPVGASCRADASCASGQCLRFDATTPGVCTEACVGDEACGQGTRCGAIKEDDLCVPASWCAQESEGCDPHVALSIASAQAMEVGLGEHLIVLGYNEPWDGGGGVFTAAESACVGDGGTCFVPEAARGEELVEEFTLARGKGAGLRSFEELPDGEQVVWGSVTIELHQKDDAGLLIALDDIHMHGHMWGNRRGIVERIDWEEGAYNDGKGRLSHLAGSLADKGASGGEIVRIRYTPTAGALRLERQGVSDLLDARWFGARTRDEDPLFDNQPILAWAMNAAKKRNAASPGSIETVLLPDVGQGDDGVYEYFGTIELPEGITLRGGAGTEVVDATASISSSLHGLADKSEEVIYDDLRFEVDQEAVTFHYRPVRVRSARTVLRVKDGEALTHIRMIKGKDDTDHIPWDAKHAFKTRQTAIWLETNVTSAGVEDLVLDGNWRNNTGVFTEGWSTESEREAWMRNSPGWAGIVANNHGGVEIPKGQQIRVKNVAVLGYGSNGLLGHAHNTWTVENVRLGDSLYNHVQYNASGSYTNFTLTGFAWGHTAWYGGTIKNLVYEDGSANEYKRDLAIFGIRGGDYGTRDENPDRWIGTDLDGFFVDMRGAGAGSMFEGLGPHIKLRHGVMIGSDTQRLGPVYKEAGNGYQKALYSDNAVENVWMFYPFTRDDGSVAEKAIDTQNTTQSVYRDLRFIPLHDEANLNTFWKSTGGYRNHESWRQGRRVQVFEGIDAERLEPLYVMRLGSHEMNPGHDIFWKDVKVSNTTSGLIVNKGSSGRVEHFPHLDKIRVFLENVSLNFHTRYRNYQVFFAVARMRRVTDMLSGATSEDEGTFTMSAAGGEEVVEIPTNLLWIPSVYALTGGRSADLVSEIEVVEREGADQRQPSLRVTLSRPLEPGEEIELSWEGAVRPWEEGVAFPTDL